MLNKFILRQINKYIGDPADLPQNYQDLFNVLSDMYEHYEKDRNMLERSIELSSQEMVDLNCRLGKETSELKKAHHELKTLFENLENVIFSVDMVNNKVLQISPACVNVYGYTIEDFFANANLWYDVVLEEDKPIIQANYPVMLAGKTFSHEHRIVCKDGTHKWIETKITPTLDEEQKLVRIDGITTDITERKEAERKILYSESRFRHLIEKSHDGIALLGISGKLLYVTPSVERIMGYVSDELVGYDPIERIHPDDREKIVAILTDLIPCYGETKHAVYRMMNKKESWRWVSSNITNLLNEPSIRAIVFNYEDITERIKVETQIEFDRRNRDALINSTNDLMWSLDTNMRLITANNAFLTTIKMMTGIDLQPGDNLLGIPGFTEKVTKKWENRYKRVLSGETFVMEEYNGVPTPTWGEISFNPILENNVVIGASCFSRNITENKKSIKLMKKSEKMMADAERIAHLGSWELELASGENKVRWSSEVYRIFGQKPGRFIPTLENFMKLVHPEDLQQVTDAVQESMENKTRFALDYRIVRPDKQIRWVRASGDVTTHKKTGKLIKMIGTAQDITERKQIEEERMKIANDLIQRNQDLEQFTYIVSHNLRAPVANIRGLTSIIKTHELDSKSYDTCMNGLETAAKRLDEVIIDLNNILQVRKEISEKRENIKFSDITGNITDTIQTMIEQGNVILKTDFSLVNEIYTVKSYLYSIFYNLISNSIKYRKPDEAPVIEIKSVKYNDKTVLIFKDNCKGIDLKLHGDKVFGLYKRFHLDVEGRGVGLYMVKTQIEALGGGVSIKSEVNKGTEFVLEFEG